MIFNSSDIVRATKYFLTVSPFVRSVDILIKMTGLECFNGFGGLGNFNGHGGNSDSLF